MDRTLYLRECRGLKVRRDGPSLWIRERGKAGRRVPVRLISRVVIIGNMFLETDAITLFAERGIPVAFLKPSGDVSAVALAYDCKTEDIRERQRVLQEDDDMQERAIRWMNMRRRALCLETLRRLSPGLAREVECMGLREHDYQIAIRTFCAHGQVVLEAVVRQVFGLVHELVLEKVLLAKLDPHCGIIRIRENFGLCKDIAQVLDAVADRLALNFLRRKTAERFIQRNGSAAYLTREGSRELVLLFEQQRPAIEAKIDSLLDDYYRLLREIAI